jgi:hypothetical protein
MRYIQSAVRGLGHLTNGAVIESVVTVDVFYLRRLYEGRL